MATAVVTLIETTNERNKQYRTYQPVLAGQLMQKYPGAVFPQRESKLSETPWDRSPIGHNLGMPHSHRGFFHE